MGLPRFRARLFALFPLVVCGLRDADAIAEEPGALPSFDAVLIATAHDPDARSSEVQRVHVGPSGPLGAPIGVVSHPPGAVVRGDVHDGVAWIVADEDPALSDWGAALYEVRSGQARRVLERVGHARKPLASASGLVFVERGYAGAPPSFDEMKAGLLRIDGISIDAYDPRTATTRALYTDSAYALHLAGEYRGALVVYRVTASGAALLTVDETSGRTRVVAPIAPFARDFSIDEARGAVVLSDRDGADPHVWTVERFDLSTGARTRLHATRDVQPAALVLPSGSPSETGIAVTAAGRRGLAVRGQMLAPLGAGFDAPVLSTTDGALLAVEHREPGARDRTVVVQLATGRAIRLGDDDKRVTILALDAAAGGVR